eukprot:5292436-Pleurochrysis_carterae.AAC.1
MNYATSNVKHNCVGLTHQRRRKRPKCKTYCVLILGHLGTRKRNAKLQFACEFPSQPGFAQQEKSEYAQLVGMRKIFPCFKRELCKHARPNACERARNALEAQT